MVAEITTALQSIKAAIDIIKGMNALKLEVAVKEKSAELLSIIIPLQENFLSMQSSYSELLTSKDKIEKELIELKNITIDRSKYVLVEIVPGTVAYSPKETNSSEPQHFICQNCFDTKNYKSILQRRFPDHKDLICNSCKTIYRISDDNKSQHISFLR